VIEYTKDGKKKRYHVEVIAVIKDTDWSYLQQTKDNRITLITCVENQPEYRLCVQGVEI
jgi:LPXTG-site transpeptidase (sortase) family protein